MQKKLIKLVWIFFCIFPSSSVFGAQSSAPISYKTGNNNRAPPPISPSSANAKGTIQPRPNLPSTKGNGKIATGGGGNIGNGQSAAVMGGGTSQITSGNAAATLSSAATETTTKGSSLEPTTVDYGSSDCEGQATRCDLAGRRDFNPILSDGVRGQSGIKARLNPPAFRYLSQQFAGVLNYRIRRFQLPAISQCLPQVQGCIRVPNLHMTNYRCTNNVNFHPAPPNRLVIDVDGMDVSVEGNLGGQVSILVPLALYGRIHADAYRVHVSVGVVLINNGTWPALQVASCSATVGQLHLDIQNGGLLGDIARQQLQAKLTRIVRQQFSRQICSRVPQILNQEINSKIPTIVPQKFSLNALVGMAMGSSCLSKMAGLGGDESEDEGESTTMAVLVRKQRGIMDRDVPMPMGQNQSSLKKRREIAAAGPQLLKDNEVKMRRQSNGTDGKGGEDDWITSEPEEGMGSTKSSFGTTTTVGTDAENTDAEAAAADADTKTAGEGDSGGGDGGGGLMVLAGLIDITKFSNIEMSLQYMNSQATPTGYTIGINGGFSQCAWGCTPFAPFPMQIPACGNNCKMADVLISDFTINSLLYHLNRVGFFHINITPDTTEFGKLMTLNCESSEEDAGAFFLEDHGVELEENGTMTKGRDSKRHKKLRKRGGRKRVRRQDDEGTCMNVDKIREFGCIGTFLPAAKSEDEEKGGKEKVDVKIRPERAPDVIIRENGTVAFELAAFIDFFAHSTGALFTTFHLDLVLNANVQVEGDNNVKATLEIVRLKVRDVGGKSGMGQDTLDSLVDLVAGKILECANSLLEKGCKIEVPEGVAGLPLDLSNLKIGFVDHALHLQSDFKLSEDSELLGGTEQCGTTTRQRRVKKRK